MCASRGVLNGSTRRDSCETFSDSMDGRSSPATASCGTEGGEGAAPEEEEAEEEESGSRTAMVGWICVPYTTRARLSSEEPVGV